MVLSTSVIETFELVTFTFAPCSTKIVEKSDVEFVFKSTTGQSFLALILTVETVETLQAGVASSLTSIVITRGVKSGLFDPVLNLIPLIAEASSEPVPVPEMVIDIFPGIVV